ncbi:uncharacterized protein PG998_005501 [Apiospora kogelbergensis]|uniref:uncharacterized protein n=1 Tax=Apiospora kogelbergensis TaxID=1337665 RepID=UPI0031304FD7
MRLARLPIALLALVVPAAVVQAQFTYPPPLDRPLTDYTSGLAQSTLNFSAGDSMFGGWYTPGRLMSYMLYRCIQTPTSQLIYPSNSSFYDRQGRPSPANDSTWEQMPLFEEGGFETGFSSGRNPIWLHGEFLAPNATTGNLCWFELYPGVERGISVYVPERGAYAQAATVDGSRQNWYFATVPFEVHPRRASGLTVTWKGGKPRPDIFSNATDPAVFAQEFPEYATSSSSRKSAAGDSIRPSGAGLFLWAVGFALMAAMN